MPGLRVFMFSLLALGAALTLGGCSATDSRFPDYRYRLTVEVDTPEGVRSAFSVIEVSTQVASKHAIPTPGKASHKVRGEAVAVELPAGQTLFALLRSEREVDWPSSVMFLLAPEPPIDEEDRFAARYANMLAMSEPKVLPRTFPDQGHLRDRPALPMLVRFRDIADPTTVERVDPDDLEASFGAGVTLRRITVQMVAEPVTSGIEKRLAWLPRVYEMGLKSEKFPPGIPLGDFKGLFLKE